jgi:hypothetical protein
VDLYSIENAGTGKMTTLRDSINSELQSAEGHYARGRYFVSASKLHALALALRIEVGAVPPNDISAKYYVRDLLPKIYKAIESA